MACEVFVNECVPGGSSVNKGVGGDGDLLVVKLQETTRCLPFKLSSSTNTAENETPDKGAADNDLIFTIGGPCKGLLFKAGTPRFPTVPGSLLLLL